MNKLEITDKILESVAALAENAQILDTQLKSLNDNKAPKSHASTATTYGVGTTANYGHCKIIDSLDKSSLTNGEALSAHQGKVLKDMIDGKQSFIELTSPVRIWDLDDGAYKLPSGCVIYYAGETSTTSITINSTGFLFITSYSTTYKNWYILSSNTSTTRYLYNGYTTATTGAQKAFNIGSSYLTSISSYVKDNLTYSTSGTSYALSAYQGYLLDQNKQNKVTASTTDLVDGTSPLATGELYFVYE